MGELYDDALAKLAPPRDLLLFLEGAYGGTPLKAAWQQGGKQADVIGLSPEGVRVGPQVFAWSEVGTTQVVKLANLTVPSASLASAKKANLMLGAALLCREAELLLLGQKYLDQALKLDPGISARIDALFSESVKDRAME